MVGLKVFLIRFPGFLFFFGLLNFDKINLREMVLGGLRLFDF